MSKTILKFTRDHGKYAKDDIAGFDPKTAQSILATGAALAQGADGEFAAPVQALGAGPVAAMDVARSAALDAREADLAAKEQQMNEAFDLKMAELMAFQLPEDEVTFGGDPVVTPPEKAATPPAKGEVETDAKDIGEAPKQGGRK